MFGTVHDIIFHMAPQLRRLDFYSLMRYEGSKDGMLQEAETLSLSMMHFQRFALGPKRPNDQIKHTDAITVCSDYGHDNF